MDRLKAMEMFVRVVERGSFSAVARDMQTTQSSVSKHVVALEQRLGVALLARTTRSLSLTPAGERYFERARQLVPEIAEAEGDAARGEQHLAGTLRIAASVGFGRLRLLPLINSFLDAHPNIQIDLRLDDGFVDLVAEGVDLAVRIGELADSSLVARRIGSSRRILVASQRYVDSLPADVGLPTTPEDLLRHNCIVYTGLATRDVWSFDERPRGSSEEQGIVKVRVRGNLKTNSSEVIRASVLAGRGIAFAPAWLFPDDLQDSGLVVLLDGWIAAPAPIHLVSPLHRRNSAKIKAFSDHVANAATWE